MRPYVIRESAAHLAENPAKLASVFDEYGVLILRDLLCHDPLFLSYVRDLKRLAVVLCRDAGLAVDCEDSLDEIVTDLAAANRRSVGHLYDIGTRPAKLLSALRLKLHPAFLALVEAIFGSEATLATPSLSDTLHIFPPGSENFRFNLPVHQDYPYLLQSPAQLTIWINLGSTAEGVGGITVWPGTHRPGIAVCHRNEHGHLEVVTDAETLTNSESVDVGASFGEVVVMHSLLWHRSNRNMTNNRTRVVQLFRYSNLTNPLSERIHWSSTEYGNVDPRGVQFEKIHPERFNPEK